MLKGELTTFKAQMPQEVSAPLMLYVDTICDISGENWNEEHFSRFFCDDAGVCLCIDGLLD